MKKIIFKLLIISLVLPILSYGQATRVTLSQLAQSGATDGQFVKWNNSTLTWEAGTVTAGGGTVTSVGLSLPSIFAVSNSPVTGSGTLTGTLATQTANLIFAGPSTGAAAVPTFRSLVSDDIPNLDVAKITSGTFATARGGTGLSTIGTALQVLRVNSAGTALEYATLSIPSGTVTSVGLSMPSIFTVSNSPVTSSGTLTTTLTNQNANLVFAGPSEGTAAAPTFRSLVAADIPALPYVPTTRTLTINGTAQDLSANRSWSVGTVTSVAALTLGTTGTDVNSSVANGTTTPVITLNIPTASSTNRGALSSTDWSTFNNKQSTITLTTTGTSGAATFSGNTLNIPQYQAAGSYVPTTRTITINGTAQDLSANRSWSVGTVTNLTSTLLASGTDISLAITNSSTTPAITLYIPTASSTNRGALSNTDWTTFNNKQSAITLTTTGNSGAATFISNTLNIPNYTLAGLGGFANPMTTLGDIIYGGTSGAPTRLAGHTTAQQRFLAQTGAGTASAAPEWVYINLDAYVYGLGRAGGQLVHGGTAAGDYLALQGSTAHSQHDRIILNYYGGNVALGGGDNLVVPLRFMEANSSGVDTNFIALKAPTTITSNVTFTLPNTDGTANQVLKTDGSGNLGWANASSISGTTNRIPYFNTSTTLGSSGLTWDNTNSRLGINVISPSATLQVKGTSDNVGTYSLYITNQAGDKVLNFDNSGKVGINVSSPATTLHFNGSMSRKAPVRTGVATSYTVLDDDSWIIVNNASSTVTLTLPTASSFQGRELMIKNVSAIAVNSTSSVPVIAITTNPGSNPPTTTTSILPATAGKWATLVSVLAGDGLWYWAIMQAN